MTTFLAGLSLGLAAAEHLLHRQARRHAAHTAVLRTALHDEQACVAQLTRHIVSGTFAPSTPSRNVINRGTS